MGEELKSAWEIALEKTAGLKADDTEQKLSSEQRKKITEIEKEYQARIAEKEIMHETKLKKLPGECHPAELQNHVMVLDQGFAQEKSSLQEEKAQKIETIKKGEA